jgi:hypothetical protein
MQMKCVKLYLRQEQAINNYCSFSSNGIFTFKGNEDSNPVIGEKGKLHLGTKLK